MMLFVSMASSQAMPPFLHTNTVDGADSTLRYKPRRNTISRCSNYHTGLVCQAIMRCTVSGDVLLPMAFVASICGVHA